MTARACPLVVVRWGESGMPALARAVDFNGDRVKVERFGSESRHRTGSHWTTAKLIPVADVLREATGEDLSRFGYLYQGCGLCYGTNPACSCNPTRDEVVA